MLAIGAKSLPRFRKGILVHMTFNLDAEGKVRINKSNIEKQVEFYSISLQAS